MKWFNTFQFAHAYACGEGMKHHTEMVQARFAAREKCYTFVSHQQEVGAAYFERDLGDPGRFVLREGADGFDQRRVVPLS